VVHVRVYLAALVLTLLPACGGDDLVIGGAIVRPTVAPTSTPEDCLSTGQPCTLGTQCCSEFCDNITGACT